jgi:pentapeptide MXKDX repeat protein
LSRSRESGATPANGKLKRACSRRLLQRAVVISKEGDPMKPLFAALLVTGLALAPAAFAEDAMKPKDAKMDKMDKKDSMSKGSMASDKMEKTGGMMDKKDSMSKDSMSKDGMKK